MRFRKATENDVDRIAELFEDGRAALAGLGIDQWQQGYPNRESAAADVADDVSYVVELDDAVVATAMVGFNGEPLYDCIDGAWLTDGDSAGARYAVVHRVAVAKDGGGRGAASFLMAQAEALAAEQGLESVRIDTHEGNAPMRGMLRKNGYRECGVVFLDPAVEECTRARIAYEKPLA